ncbi:MAG TPA: HAMP domain-containing sensor histidine kinase [Longimicrobium sp.]|nr:HAMP domain-containing sensor histidine kinase [Longimicrobium sp.]
MRPLRRQQQMAPGSAFLVGLLLVLLGLSTVLAYQAVDAARSEARSTDRALRGYASFASWELARRADAALRAGLTAAGAAALPVGEDAPPSAEVAARAERVVAAWCRCPGAVRGAFRFSSDPRAPLDVAAPSPALDGWLRVRAPGSAPGGFVAHGADSARGDVEVGAVEVGGAPYLLVYRLASAGGERHAVGFVVDAAPAAARAYGQAYAGGALLPDARRAGGAGAVTAALLRPDGVAVWSSIAAHGAAQGAWVDAKIGAYPPEPLVRGNVAERLDGLFAGLTSQVSVRPDLVVGTPPQGPRSRLPLLLTVFGLTLALVCVAIVQLRRQQELVRLRDDFVSGVSHELRTPLAQIRLFSDLLDSGRLAAPEQRSRSVRIIAEEARRLSWLVENILHFSRAQRGAGRVQPNPLVIAPLLREIVDAFAPLAREKSVTFSVEADEGVLVRADPDALRQVLLNLLDNAVKYGPPGQTVRVRAELRGLALRMSVDDRGPGVPWEDRRAVWEPYRRLARDAEGATGGSGIGLAVVKDLVELHGGRVGVGEVPGGGARFWIELPYAMHAGPPGEKPPHAAAAPARAVAP